MFSYSSHEFQIVKTMQVMVKHATLKPDHLKWFFEENYSIKGMTLLKCCQLLDLHPDLVRIRMQYQLYKQSICATTKLNTRLPAVLRDEINFELGLPAVMVAERIWQEPGIIMEDINLADLLNRRYVASVDNHLYLTGRVPVINQCLYWSRCWSFYG